jgi:hypothetical protein
MCLYLESKAVVFPLTYSQIWLKYFHIYIYIYIFYANLVLLTLVVDPRRAKQLGCMCILKTLPGVFLCVCVCVYMLQTQGTKFREEQQMAPSHQQIPSEIEGCVSSRQRGCMAFCSTF